MEEKNTPILARRALLRSLVAASVGSELIQVTPASAQTHAHNAPLPESGLRFAQPPVSFTEVQYRSLSLICQLIMPPDHAARAGGAIEAGVPAFIDLLSSENKDYQRRLRGGLSWLDALCTNRFGESFAECTAVRQKEILDTIAFRSNAVDDSSLLPGIEFFALLRDLVLDGFFTSQIGIEYLAFRGNRAVSNFLGCPES